MPGTLLVTGGDEHARTVYDRERRGYWSAALPLVLEKHGYLDVTVRGPEVLSEAATWHRYDAVLVARLPAGMWSRRIAEAAASGRAAVLVEGPLPSNVAGRLGITKVEPAPPDGTLVVADADLSRRADELFGQVGGRVHDSTSRPVDRVPERDWTRIRAVPLGPDQADAWRAVGWDVTRWELEAGAKVLAQWRPNADPDQRWPAIVQRDQLIGCCFGLFAFLGQSHTVAPFEGPEYRNWPRTLGIEALLCALIDEMHRSAGGVRLRALPWPQDGRWALGVRHDFDRALDAAQVQEVLAGHKRVGTAATWYWRSRHLTPGREGTGNEAARLVSRTRQHEVAHHTELLWQESEAEQRAIEKVVGRRVRGTSAHGDPNCFRWQGAPNVLWAEAQQLDYTEFISHAHLHPHRFAALRPDGRIAALRVICLPHHESFDRSTKPGDHAADRMAPAAEMYAKAGGYMQVLNHPDLNLPDLFATLDALPRERRLDLTAEHVADWWSRTHVAGELTIERDAKGRLVVTSLRGAQGLVLELRRSDGETREVALYLEPGQAAVIDGRDRLGTPRAESEQPKWEAVAPLFVSDVRAYYEATGHQPEEDAVISSVRTNSELVPGRAEQLLRYLDRCAGVRDIQGRRVLEIGSGFGALGTYLLLEYRPAQVTAVELRPEFAACGRSVAERTGIEGIEFLVGDMRGLDDVADDSIEVAIINNALIYVDGYDDMRTVARSVERVLAPGGVVLIHHANRWRLRDPFTRAPIVHIAPAPARRLLQRRMGWESSSDRVQLVSVRRLKRMLRQAGLEEVRSAAVRQGHVRTGVGAMFAGYYAVVGRKAR